MGSPYTSKLADHCLVTSRLVHLVYGKYLTCVPYSVLGIPPLCQDHGDSDNMEDDSPVSTVPSKYKASDRIPKSTRNSSDPIELDKHQEDEYTAYVDLIDYASSPEDTVNISSSSIWEAAIQESQKEDFPCDSR